MANHYCQSSSLITVPSEKIEQARQIVARVEKELEESDDNYVGFVAAIEQDGVWIHEVDSIDPDHVEMLVSALVNELDLPGIHVCSWAYTCSKPRIDEFGGGAFAVQKGRDTVWIDAASEAKRVASKGEFGE
jgi:hypothetical protein